ncbi:DUF882 domain-containing protein [Ahrensia sp. AH-315-G08]|nr:DUF882 domain-containing protein [Ahrensia sp. AH-315-G08]
MRLKRELALAAFMGRTICGVSDHPFDFVFRDLRLAILGLLLLVFSGCVSGSPVPPGDLVTVLSPTQLENQAPQETVKLAETTTRSVGGTAEADGTTKTAISTAEAVSEASEAVKSSIKPASEAKSNEIASKKIPAKSKPEVVKTEPTTAKAPATPNITKPDAAIVKPTPPPTKRISLLASLFRSNNADKVTERSAKRSGVIKKPNVKRPRARVNRRSGSLDALPGVRVKNLFGIFKTNDKQDPDLDEPFEVASLSNLARRGNFGLLLQTKKVKVACFPRRLVKLLKKVERHFGRTPIVTSGYRSRAKNRRIRGARNSTHIRCAAADIQVKGISKWKLAKYLRSLPGRGGVGTYCHTKSVHIDIGKVRDWNWRCRRRRKRKS